MTEVIIDGVRYVPASDVASLKYDPTMTPSWFYRSVAALKVAFIEKTGIDPNVLYLGKLQMGALYATQPEECRIMFNGMHVVSVNLDDHIACSLSYSSQFDAQAGDQYERYDEFC